MRIITAEVFAIRLPMHQPFVVSYGSFQDMPSILVKLTAENGLVGWGEAVPDPHVTGETLEGTFSTITNTLLPAIADVDIFSIELLHQRMNERLLANPSAKAALDIAFHDLMGKAVREPLFKLLGGQLRAELLQPYVISIKSPDAVAIEAREAVERGYEQIKLKLGARDGLDVARIRALRGAVPGSTTVRVDANQGWSRTEALDVMARTETCNVEWYEQPLVAHDLEGMAVLQRSSRARIMLDEAVHSPQDLVRAITLGSGDMVNIKLMKAGGISPAAHLTSVAEAAGMTCQIGSMVESAIGTAAGLHLACARRGIETNELVGPEMISKDVAALDYEPGRIQIPTGHGLGIDVNQNTVDALTVHSTHVPLGRD